MEKCDRCDGNLIRRQNRTTKEFFWGCSNYPKCKGHTSINRTPAYEWECPTYEEMFDQAGRDFDDWYDRMKRLGMI